MSFRFHPEARQELHAAARFYAIAGRQVGLDFAVAIERAVFSVRTDPGKFREVEPGVRICRLHEQITVSLGMAAVLAACRRLNQL